MIIIISNCPPACGGGGGTGPPPPSPVEPPLCIISKGNYNEKWEWENDRTCMHIGTVWKGTVSPEFLHSGWGFISGGFLWPMLFVWY